MAPIERGLTDNHGHAAWMAPNEALVTFGQRSRHHGAKIVGLLPDGTMLPDACVATSGVSFEISGTRTGKTSSIITTISEWTGPQVVLDPSCEVAPMTWRMLEDRGRKVVIVSPESDPRNTDGHRMPWAHLIGQFNPLDWVDVHATGASTHVFAMARYFFDEEDREAGENAYFRKSARSLIACILAHILWLDESDPTPRILPTMRAVISLDSDELRDYLTAVRSTSQSTMARHLAGPLCKLAGEATKTFANIHDEANQATAWLTDPALAAMVSGASFAASDLASEPISVFLHLPMDTLINHHGMARVLFGAMISAKIASRPDTKALFIADEAWLLGRMKALEIVLFAGGRHGIALHAAWQSVGQIEKIWGREGRKFWFDNAAWIGISKVRDPAVAHEISDACGTFPVLAYNESRNASTQAGSGGSVFGRYSRGWNTGQHEIKRSLLMLSEVITDLDRDDLLILGLRKPLRLKRALWWRIPRLRREIEPSPYQEAAD